MNYQAYNYKGFVRTQSKFLKLQGSLKLKVIRTALCLFQQTFNQPKLSFREFNREKLFYLIPSQFAIPLSNGFSLAKRSKCQTTLVQLAIGGEGEIFIASFNQLTKWKSLIGVGIRSNSCSIQRKNFHPGIDDNDNVYCDDYSQPYVGFASPISAQLVEVRSPIQQGRQLPWRNRNQSLRINPKP